MAESLVLALLTQHNKPFNTQTVADFLATQGVKKTQAQKALDNLVASGKIAGKEFGKTKIYFPCQSGLPVLPKEEIDAKLDSIRQVQEQLQQESAAVKAVQQELNALKSTLTAEELAQQIQQLKHQLPQLEQKLAALSGGGKTVTKAERQKMETALTSALTTWRKRKATFRAIWDTISEGLEGKQADLFEEMGVETDEMMGVNLRDVENLLSKKRKV